MIRRNDEFVSYDRPLSPDLGNAIVFPSWRAAIDHVLSRANLQLEYVGQAIALADQRAMLRRERERSEHVGLPPESPRIDQEGREG